MRRPAATHLLAASLLLAACGGRSALQDGPGPAGDVDGGSGTSPSGRDAWPTGPAPSTPVVVAPLGSPSWLGVVALGDRFGIAWGEAAGGLTAGPLWLAVARRDGVGIVGSAPRPVGALGIARSALLARIGDDLGVLYADAGGSLHLARFDRDGAPLDDAPILVASTTVAWPAGARAEGDHLDVAWGDFAAPGLGVHRRLRLDGAPIGPEVVLDGVTPRAVAYGSNRGAALCRTNDPDRVAVVAFDPLGASPPTRTLLDPSWRGFWPAASVDASGALDFALGGTAGVRVGRWRGGADVADRAHLDGAYDVALARRSDGALAVMATDAEISENKWILQTRITVRALGAGDGGPVGGATAIETPPRDGNGCLVGSAFDAGDADYGVAWVDQCDVDGAGPTVRFALVPWR